MAKAVALFASALCVLAIATVVQSQSQSQTEPPSSNNEEFHIEGRVYCDTCRVQFETKLSKRLAGAKVELKCRDPVNQQMKYETWVLSNSTGDYRISVVGDHEDEICEVSIMSSPDESCKEPMDGLNNARIDLALNDGIHQSVRYANPLGFMIKESLPECKKLLDDMGFIPIGGSTTLP